MGRYSAEFRRCLERVDVAGVKAIWALEAPNDPLPDDMATIVTIHQARTSANSIDLKLRQWSHRWLIERGLQSSLPERLKPKAERMDEPKIVSAVGVAVNSLSDDGQERAKAIEKAMSDAVMECYADGITDPELVRARMLEARMKFLRGE